MNAKYQAIDVANYILWYANDKHEDGQVTALKLQKIIYYVAARFFKEKSIHLFDERIEKWRFGPVVPSVYHTFKGRGYGVISKPIARFVKDGDEVISKSFDESVIDCNDRVIIDPVIDQLVELPAFKLVDMTHKEEAWKRDEDTILTTWINPEYTDDDLLKAVNTLEGL